MERIHDNDKVLCLFSSSSCEDVGRYVHPPVAVQLRNLRRECSNQVPMNLRSVPSRFYNLKLHSFIAKLIDQNFSTVTVVHGNLTTLYQLGMLFVSVLTE
jgi:hypothetical protein